MSTTFEVYPSTREIPSFQQLLDRSTTELRRFLPSVDIDARPLIRASVQSKDGNELVPFDQHAPFTWSDKNYVWFYVGEIPGGTDAYFRAVDDLTLKCWSDLTEPRLKVFEEPIHQCLEVGHYWSFRRSVNQPAIINVVYGLIAASLAELTRGFVFSDDSAWDWERFPAPPEEFFRWYFVPELAISENFREWSARCIGFLREELSA